MSILFLDFDGVLNSSVFLLSKSKDDGNVKLDFDQARLDPKALKLLNQIHNTTHCIIIVSSTWRINSNRHYLHALLLSVGFDGYIWGCTPQGESRGEEIAESLEQLKTQGFDTSRYVVLDDDNVHGHDGHLVRTDPHRGLTEAEVAQAIALLGPHKKTICHKCGDISDHDEPRSCHVRVL